MANFTVGDAQVSRFDGDFQITPAGGHTPALDEDRYLAAIGNLLQALADDEAEDKKLGDGLPAHVHGRELRARAAADLRADAVEFAKPGLAADKAADNALVIKGRYLAAREQYARLLFHVGVEENDKKLAVDVTIAVNPHLGDGPSPDKQKLFVAICSTWTVVATVCRRILERGTNDREVRRAALLLDEYARKLAGIASVGLEGRNVELAGLALEDLRGEFVAREAGRIKNTYVTSLGRACALAAALCFVAYGAVVLGLDLPTGFFTRNQSFLLAAGGAAIGTWLSFSIRRVKLSFDDLAVLEEDLLDPSIRVIFVIGLTVASCLLFVTGAMNIEIGALKTSSFVGPTALLVGVFFGIGERALATAISGRAAAFVKGLGAG